jgi:hypothetical protein
MVPSLTVANGQLFYGGATTWPTCLDCRESIAQRWRCLRNFDERA